MTAGAIVARDAETGRRNWSIARVRPLGGSRALVGIAPNHHLAILARAAAERGERLPIAVAIGLHPALLVAACLYLRLGDDELEVAGALLGEPVELVGLPAPSRSRCRRTPRSCSEGLLDVTATVDEGRVSRSSTACTSTTAPAATATFTALTRRADAVLQVVEPGYHPEHVLLGAVAIAAGLEQRAARATSRPSRACTSRTAAAAARRSSSPSGRTPRGDAAAAIAACFARVSLVKHVTVVDDDVDVADADAVAWAVATRLRPERDLTVLPDQRADRAEPLERDRTVAKTSLDATRHEGDRDWERAAPPADVVARIRVLLAAAGATPRG